MTNEGYCQEYCQVMNTSVPTEDFDDRNALYIVSFLDLDVEVLN
jgi:hypothetical protein